MQNTRGGKNLRFSTEIAVYLGNGTRQIWYGIVEFNVPLDTLHSIGHFGDKVRDRLMVAIER